jgi:hypothetical protein
MQQQIWLTLLVVGLVALGLLTLLRSAWGRRAAWKLSGRSAARRVAAARFNPGVLETLGRSLILRCAGAFGAESIFETRRSHGYLRAAGDDNRPRPWLWLWVTAIVIVVLCDGFIVGHTLDSTGVAAVDAAPEMLRVFSIIAGCLVSGLLAIGMHLSAQRASWKRNGLDTRGSAIRQGITLPDRSVSLAQYQELDASEPAVVRRWVRMERGGAYWPAVVAFLFVVIVAVAMAYLRYEELLKLRALDTPDLPSNASFFAAMALQATAFIALQLLVFFISYQNTWAGRESAQAYRNLHCGRLNTPRDVIQHNLRVLHLVGEVYTSFYIRVHTLNFALGNGPLPEPLNPADVIAELLKERYPADPDQVSSLLEHRTVSN